MRHLHDRLRATLLGTLLLAFLPHLAGAQFYDIHCTDPFLQAACARQYRADVEFLWWKPCIDDLDYAFSFRTNDSGTTVNYDRICPEWEPGVRLQFKVPECSTGWELGASWTYLGGNSSNALDAPSKGGASSPLLHPGLRADLAGSSGGVFAEVEGDLDFTYHDWDVLFSYDLSRNECYSFSPFIGIAGIYLEQELNVDLENGSSQNNGDTGEIRWDSHYWGVGLRTGTYYEYRFDPCVTFFARAEGTLLAGEACSENKQEVFSGTAEATFDFKDKDPGSCLCIPGYHLSAGVLYRTCICGCEYQLKFGYEFVEWHNAPNHRSYSGENLAAEAAHSSSPDTRTLGFHGLFAGLRLSF